MTKYPVGVHFDRYGGRDPRKLKRADNFNRIAGLVQEYINGEVAKWPMDSQGTFFSDVIAEAIHEDIKLIQLVIGGIGGSLNVATIYKGDREDMISAKTAT